MRSVSPAVKLALAAMSTALSVLCMYVASLTNISRAAMLFLASLMVWIPLREKGGVLYGFLCYIATAALSFLLIANKLYCCCYLMLFGLFGFIQLAFDSLTRNRVLSFILKLLCCSLLCMLMLWAGSQLFDLDITLMKKMSEFGIPLWAFILIVEAALSLAILLYGFCTRVFDNNLRKKLVKRD